MYLQSIGWKICHAGLSFNSTHFLAYSLSKIMLEVKKMEALLAKKRRFISLTYTLIKFNLTALNTLAFKLRLYKKNLCDWQKNGNLAGSTKMSLLPNLNVDIIQPNFAEMLLSPNHST